MICPLCSSKRISRQDVKEAAPAGPSGEKKFHMPMVYRDGKDGWKDFHSADLRQCLECGGVEFDFDRKKNEKTCKKCGNVVRVARPSA